MKKKYFVDLDQFEIEDLIKRKSRITIHKKECDIVIYFKKI